MLEAQTRTWQATDWYQSTVPGLGTPDIELLQKVQGAQRGGVGVFALLCILFPIT